MVFHVWDTVLLMFWTNDVAPPSHDRYRNVSYRFCPWCMFHHSRLLLRYTVWGYIICSFFRVWHPLLVNWSWVDSGFGHDLRFNFPLWSNRALTNLVAKSLTEPAMNEWAFVLKVTLLPTDPTSLWAFLEGPLHRRKLPLSATLCACHGHICHFLLLNGCLRLDRLL